MPSGESNVQFNRCLSSNPAPWLHRQWLQLSLVTHWFRTKDEEVNRRGSKKAG